MLLLRLAAYVLYSRVRHRRGGDPAGGRVRPLAPQRGCRALAAGRLRAGPARVRPPARAQVEEQIWSSDTGPFGLRDETGSVLVAPALLDHTLNAFGHPAQQVLDEIREEGGEPWRYQAGRLGVLLEEGVLPRDVLGQFAGPSARTTGYRVCEDILRPGLAFHVFAVPGDLDGQPMMAQRYQDVWSVSARPMPVALAEGGRRAEAWTVRFGLAGVALFAASAFLLIGAGHPPG